MLSKISLRLPKRFQWLTIITFILITLLGYFPNLNSPVKKVQAVAFAHEQKGEVVARSFKNPLGLPHPGYLSTRFSSRHPGVDIASGLGMPVHPITNGEVVEATIDFWGLGKYVVVSHENNFKSKYAHMGKIYVKVGDQVNPNNILGEVGLTGQTSGPHTHLEITHEGILIDPLTLLPDVAGIPTSSSTGGISTIFATTQ